MSPHGGEYLEVGENRPRNRDPLTLPAGQAHRDGTRVHTRLGGQVEADEVPLDHEVEQLGQRALARRRDVEDGVDHLVDDVEGEIEPTA